MALHDTDVHRFMAFGVAGLSVLADSLSAIKYAKIETVRDEQGFITDFICEGTFPKFGNDDDRVDQIAVEQLRKMYTELKKTPAYRGAEHTLSVLTITSNVVYGKKTASTPDGRKRAAVCPGGQSYAQPGRKRRACIAQLRGKIAIRLLPRRYFQYLLYYAVYAW